jgi:hypothetical protein
MVRLLRGFTAASLTTLAVVVVPLPGSGADAATPSATTCGADGTPAVVALQDRHFFVDSASTVQLLSGYAGYRVLAGATARSHLWLGFSDFTGGALNLAPKVFSAHGAHASLPVSGAGPAGNSHRGLSHTGAPTLELLRLALALLLAGAVAAVAGRRRTQG